MKFEWDEQKNRGNISKHGFNFADAKQVFNAPMLIRLDTRQNYGEERWVGIGISHDRIVVIAYTERNNGKTILIISMRKALKYEREHFKNTL